MNILYIITILAVYILFMLIYKTEKRQNAISWLAISVILILCYNTLICVICTFLGATCTLLNLSICNVITIVLLLANILKNKKVQKYYVKLSDIIFGILTLAIVIIIAYKQYGFPFELKYEVTDGSTHYFFAQQFYQNSALLYKESTEDIYGLYNSGFRLPGAYVNEGILFKVFDGIISKTDIYVIFDLFILYLSGILFYYLLKTYAKGNKKLCVLAAIFSIIYMLGYQLNSMLYGFVYLSLALDIVIALLLAIANYKKQEITDTISLSILLLLSFGVFFTYAYFIPIVYISIIINIIMRTVKNKEKIASEENLMELACLIIIPLILGATYFIIMPLAGGRRTEVSSIGTNGKIYQNYITNLLAFIPIFITSIILSIKNKKKENDFSTILFILAILFAVILFIGNKLEIVSDYYFFKAYYIIWPLAICNSYMALAHILEEKHKIGTYIYISIYIIVMVISTLILKKNIGINDIFYHNKECIENEAYALNSGEIKIAEMVEGNIKPVEIYILKPEHRGRMRWMSVLYHDQDLYIDFETDYNRTIEKWLSEREEEYYLAYHEDYRKITDEEYLDEESNKYKIVYNDEYGFILKRIKKEQGIY